MTTQIKDNIRQPKQCTDGTVYYGHNQRALLATTGPASYIEALVDSRWKQVIDDEYNALLKNETWELVPFSRQQNIIDCQWVFKLESKPDGSIDRYKARSVAKEFK